MINNEKCETGRSMVEMLGVLAVIGVLSIGSILGYRAAITRHTANQVMHTVSLAYTELQLGHEPSYSPVSGATFETVNYLGSPAFIRVTLDDAEVCKLVKNFAPDLWETIGNCE